MSSFAGVSVITEGKNCTTSAVNVHKDSGYHLLVVQDYSRTIQEIPNGKSITTGCFIVGGHEWYIEYYPNGQAESSADFISLDLCFAGDSNDVEAKFVFSFVDQVEKQKPKEISAAAAYDFDMFELACCHVNFIKRGALERSAHLEGDCVTIRCDIMVCEDPNTGDDDGSMPDIHQHFDYLLRNKVGADVTFVVRGKTFAAHRCVLAARSKVFMAQLFGPMTEGTTSGAIQIKDMRAKVFAALLKFIYTDSFSEMDKDNYMEEGHEEEEGQDEEEDKKRKKSKMRETNKKRKTDKKRKGQEEDVMWLQWLQDLLVAADKYDLQRLKFLCGKKLSEHIGVSSVVSTLALAEQLNCHGLKDACLKFIQVQSPKCLHKVMENESWEHLTMAYPSVLKEIIAKLASNQKNNRRGSGR